jgi:RNA polymerase sigma-70 factor (ECF subfamily)
MSAFADDADFVARLQAGDNGAFEQLVRRTTGPLLATARRFVRNEDDARDAVQSAFVRALQALPKFRQESRLSTWLHRILVNECLMRLRRRHDDVELDEELLPAFQADGHQLQPSTDWSESAEAAIERRETSAIVQAAIDQLPETYRTVLILRDIEELTPAEAAEMLGISTNTLKVRLHRARQALRTLLQRQFGGTR